jgi:exopolysaccharide biosynthesis protein
MQRRSTVLALVAVVAVVAIAAGFIARGPIERNAFLRQARAALGTSVDVSSADYSGGTWDVRGLVIGTATSPVRLEATRATIATGSDPVRVDLLDPIVTLANGVQPADATPVVQDGIAAFERVYPRADVTAHAGTVNGPGIDLTAIESTLHLGVSRPTLDGTLELASGGNAYPITLRTVGQADAAHGLETPAPGVESTAPGVDSRAPGVESTAPGVEATASGLKAGPLSVETPAQGIEAPAIPLAALAAMQPATNDSGPTAGFARDVDLVIGTTMSGTAQLDGATFAFGDHRLHGVHARLVFGGGGVGAKKLVGFLDAAPFDAAGEVHDLPDPYGWLVTGSRDLRNLASLIRAIAAEPQLRSVHVDTTAPGLAFAQYAMMTENGPLAISVLAIDPEEPTLRIDTAIAEDHVISNGERTSAMGLRTGAVAGVNGDYFDIGRTYQPQGMLVRSGEIVRGPVDRAALVVDKTKHVRFDEFHIVGTVRAAGQTFPITQLNDWPAGEITVITSAFGKELPPRDDVTFAALEPAGSAGRYRVTSVGPVTSPLPVSFGIAIGPKVRVALHTGELVDVAYHLEPAASDAVAAIGGGPILVRNGAWYEDPHAPAPDERNYRWPVIALARQADDRLLLVAADGRHPERSIGMTRPEFGDLLIRLGAVDAMALDSGGSVTLVSRAPGDATVSVRNVPSDHSAERWVSDALFIYSSAPLPSLVAPTVAPTPIPEARPAP